LIDWELLETSITNERISASFFPCRPFSPTYSQQTGGRLPSSSLSLLKPFPHWRKLHSYRSK
jgi:hypothetical protein